MDPPILNDPASRLLELAGVRERRWLVALSGLPGSGKTVLAQHLQTTVHQRAGRPCLISLGMDGFHLTRAALSTFPDPVEALSRRGAPWTFDASALLKRLRCVSSSYLSHRVPWPTFDHSVGEPVDGGQSVPPDMPVVLVEGLYLLGGCSGVAGSGREGDAWDEIARCFDERWYLDTDPEVAKKRLTERHRAVWGLTAEEAGLRIESNDRLNAEIVGRCRAKADWLIADSGWLR